VFICEGVNVRLVAIVLLKCVFVSQGYLCCDVFFLDRSVCVCFALRRLLLWYSGLKTWRRDFWLRVCVSAWFAFRMWCVDVLLFE